MAGFSNALAPAAASGLRRPCLCLRPARRVRICAVAAPAGSKLARSRSTSSTRLHATQYADAVTSPRRANGRRAGRPTPGSEDLMRGLNEANGFGGNGAGKPAYKGFFDAAPPATSTSWDAPEPARGRAVSRGRAPPSRGSTPSRSQSPGFFSTSSNVPTPEEVEAAVKAAAGSGRSMARQTSSGFFGSSPSPAAAAAPEPPRGRSAARGRAPPSRGSTPSRSVSPGFFAAQGNVPTPEEVEAAVRAAAGSGRSLSRQTSSGFFGSTPAAAPAARQAPEPVRGRSSARGRAPPSRGSTPSRSQSPGFFSTSSNVPTPEEVEEAVRAAAGTGRSFSRKPSRGFF